MVVLYEVNTWIVSEAEEEFLAFLREHVKQMLGVQGFQTGVISKPDKDDTTPEGKEPFCCTYTVESRDLLQRYFDNEAADMRADTMKKFEGRVTASRRIHAVLN